MTLISFVDDGSSDKTLEILKNKSSLDNRVKYLSFSRNFGKEAAMFAGISKSRDIHALIIIDADLQHPPELIPKMLEQFKAGYEQVIAKRDRKGEGFLRKQLSKLYYKIVNKHVDVEMIDGMGDFRLISNRVVNVIADMPEYNRFSKGIFSWVGFKSTFISYENNERASGQSKWSLSSLLNYGIDGLISFNNKPLRALIYLGLMVFFASLLYICFILLSILMNGVDSPGYFTTIFSVLFLGGVQLISIGVVGEYIGRIYYEVKKRPVYLEEDSNLDE